MGGKIGQTEIVFYVSVQKPFDIRLNCVCMILTIDPLNILNSWRKRIEWGNKYQNKKKTNKMHSYKLWVCFVFICIIIIGLIRLTRSTWSKKKNIYVYKTDWRHKMFPSNLVASNWSEWIDNAIVLLIFQWHAHTRTSDIFGLCELFNLFYFVVHCFFSRSFRFFPLTWCVCALCGGEQVKVHNV